MNNPHKKNAKLVLSNGITFPAFSFGASGTTVGEIVFNTGMTGYQEVITDPSYYGQILTFTYPEIGNTGINHEDSESSITVKGIIVRNYSSNKSNWRSVKSFNQWLIELNIIGLYGIDTRALVKILRCNGSMNGLITVYGKSGHSAFAGSYINPCTALAKIIAKLKSSTLDNGTKFMPPSNLEFTKMNVDNLSENVVPQYASAKFNVRFNSKHKSFSLKKKLNKIINAVAKKEKCKTKLEYKVSGEAFYTKPNKEIYMVKKIVKKVTGNSAKLNCRGGTSDSRFLGSIPRLELGLRNTTIHMVDERSPISDLKKLTKIYYNILENYF